MYAVVSICFCLCLNVFSSLLKRKLRNCSHTGRYSNWRFLRSLITNVPPTWWWASFAGSRTLLWYHLFLPRSHFFAPHRRLALFSLHFCFYVILRRSALIRRRVSGRVACVLAYSSSCVTSCVEWPQEVWLGNWYSIFIPGRPAEVVPGLFSLPLAAVWLHMVRLHI